MSDLLRSHRPFFVTLIISVVLIGVFISPQFLRIFYPYRHRQTVETYAAEYGVDPLLVVAVMRTESSFNKDAVSDKGALGLMQIMPETAQWILTKLELDPLSTEEIMRPETNIRLGTWYLAYLKDEFKGRTDLVIAAYNAGPGQVKSWLVQNIWSGRYADRTDIPFPETQLFLYKVQTAYGKYQDLYR